MKRIFSIIFFLAYSHISSCYECKFPKSKGDDKYIEEPWPITEDKDFKFQRVSGTGGNYAVCSTDNSCIMNKTPCPIQVPLLVLSDGVKISNLIIGQKAGTGIRCEGSCTLENVYWENMCWHGAGFYVKNGDPSTTTYEYKVIGGAARNTPAVRKPAQKMFVHRGPGTLTVENFCGQTFYAVYSSGDMVGPHYLKIKNSKFADIDRIASAYPQTKDRVTLENIKLFDQSDEKKKLKTVCVQDISTKSQHPGPYGTTNPKKFFGPGEDPKVYKYNGEPLDQNVCNYEPSQIKLLK